MSDNLVITMCDDNYWLNGEYFIKTRNRVDADFILFTPDLSDDKVKVCHKNDIGTIRVKQDEWNTKCQSLKLKFILEALDTYKNVTFCDFDTFFINDWNKVIFGDLASLGVTVTNGYPEWKYARSKANGGVIFAKSNILTKEILDFAYYTLIPKGSDDFVFPSYDMIWKTLEDPNRKASKRHYRTNHAWWCDQIFLSALCFDSNVYDDIMFFPCKKYNILNSYPTMQQTPGLYIGHLKKQNHVVKGKISG